MHIQHNIPAMSAGRSNRQGRTRLTRSLEKLASGYSINRAGDNAAGLAVSEKMRAQILGIGQGEHNCEDGISLIQTLEGALKESAALIQKCRMLASQCANGTYQDEVDREAMELEYEQLCEEIDHISDTDFNGIVMLNGGVMHNTYTEYLPNTHDLSWEPLTFVNNTDYSGFYMTLTPLSGLDTFLNTYDDPIVDQMLEELNDSEVGVDLSTGVPTYYFKNPVPTDLSIETKGSKAIISSTINSQTVPIAEVRCPDIDNTATSNGVGLWNSSTGSIPFTYPTSLSAGDGRKLEISKNADEYDLSSATNSNQARREEFTTG